MTPIIPLKNIVAILHQLHPLPSGLIPPPIFGYQLEHIFVLDRILFTQAIATIPHLFLDKLSGMVCEHLLGCFIPKDPSSGFLKLFHIVTVVVHGDIPKSVALMLGTIRLLAMAKVINGLHFIIIGEMFLQFISHSIVLQLRGPFQEHLSLYQFVILTLGGCEAIPFGIRTLLNLHLNWAMM
jgi:hypothetical protein